MTEQPSKKACTLQQESRAFQSDWEEKYFLIEIDSKAHCLLCSVVLSTLKSYNVERHYKSHSAQYNCYKGESRKRKLELLKSARNKQTNMFKSCKVSGEITMASFKVSHLLTHNMKPYLNGEIMKQAIITLAEKCCSTSIQL